MDHILSALLWAQAQTGDPFSGGGGGSEGGAPAPAPSSGGGGWENLIFIGIMLVVFYFLLIRPQQKRAKKHRTLMESLKRGDTVITNGGMYGRITAIDGNVVTIEIAKNTKVKMLKSHVGGVADADTEKELDQGAKK